MEAKENELINIIQDKSIPDSKEIKVTLGELRELAEGISCIIRAKAYEARRD